jgi:hypothetical protein
VERPLPGTERLERQLDRFRARMQPTLNEVLRQTHEIG